MDALDRAEGYPVHYKKEEVKVITAKGPRIADAYIAPAEKTKSGLIPYDWYKAYVVNGAKEHKLPEDYLAKIELVQSQPDPDNEKAAIEWAILKGK